MCILFIIFPTSWNSEFESIQSRHEKKHFILEFTYLAQKY